MPRDFIFKKIPRGSSASRFHLKKKTPGSSASKLHFKRRPDEFVCCRSPRPESLCVATSWVSCAHNKVFVFVSTFVLPFSFTFVCAFFVFDFYLLLYLLLLLFCIYL